MIKTIKNFKTLNNDFKGVHLNTLIATLYNNKYEYDVFISTTPNPKFFKITVFDFIHENGFQFETTSFKNFNNRIDITRLLNDIIKYINLCLNINDLKILDF